LALSLVASVIRERVCAKRAIGGTEKEKGLAKALHLQET
jgi:hypothetical protein